MPPRQARWRRLQDIFSIGQPSPPNDRPAPSSGHLCGANPLSPRRTGGNIAAAHIPAGPMLAGPMLEAFLVMPAPRTKGRICMLRIGVLLTVLAVAAPQARAEASRDCESD